ncbi:MAG: glycosyltransferase family 4 protein [Tistlia sp.]|uniref:glycosyltransferase family 4 protein n=1 Tax=Tistlia sp. TaxID=3057121 RepID=UPI0034A51ACA
MRILVHDYSGHPFQLELSRWLAERGHQTLHLYSAGVPTPQGGVLHRAGDAPGFAVEPVGPATPLAKYDLPRRFRQEHAYGRALAERARRFAPEAVLSGNCSPQIQRPLQRYCRRRGARFLYWLQDLYAEAGVRVLARRSHRLAGLAAPLLRRFEAESLRRSDAVIAITADFRPLLEARGVRPERIAVIENWAPLRELAPVDRRNAWSGEQGLDERFVLLYAGTLGVKHNPEMLAALARAFRDDPAVRVVVVSEGLGRDHLEQAKAAEGLAGLELLDWQPYERLPEVLGSADLLLAILEPEAGVFAVPSKVLTSLCTARPILAAIPPENLAARLLLEAGGGLCVAPGNTAGFLAAARRLRRDAPLRAELAAAGRAYAERTFDIERIGPRFLALLEGRSA